MGRKAYIADVATAATQQLPGITSVAKGSEDGDLHICFTPLTGPAIEVSVISLEVGGYPSENIYMITTESMDLPDGVNTVLSDIQDSSAGITIPDLVSAISKKLTRHLASGTLYDPVNLDDEDEEMEDEEDAYDGESDAYPDSDDDWDKVNPTPGASLASAFKLKPEEARKLNQRIRADLRAVKLAGFKIGILTGAKAESVSTIISISIKVDKLGLSEEAIQAWDLEPHQYIVLLIRYSDGYKTFDIIMSQPAKALEIECRVGVGNRYKPTLVAALAAFTDSNKDHSTSADKSHAAKEEDKSKAGFASLFISSSLNEFINQSMISLLKIRNNVGLSWSGAKLWFNLKQSRIEDKDSELPSEFYESDSGSIPKNLPDIFAKDHLTDDQTKQVSFPLIAAQFTLRYLARCTEYCLVCHDRMEEEFEALKPYVCSKPLCLYQYMSLGFGPSVEHEILTQPYVVDLLVSFCYAAALTQRIREYPTGMSLMVPPVINAVVQHRGAMYDYTQPIVAQHVTPEESLINVKFDPSRCELIFDLERNPVRNGDWVAITFKTQPPVHCRVADVSLYPTVALCKIAAAPTPPHQEELPVPTPVTTPPLPPIVEAKMATYDQNFDEMSDTSKAEEIVLLLRTLPSIREMRTYLLHQSRMAEPNLRSWTDRVSPAALGILRWIVASNRSCIVQVDKCPGQDDLDMAMAKIRLDQRMSNVSESYVQFRFAQGAPDKEQRFLNALKDNKDKLNKAYPTLFAWHGSPLHNWHSIIRSGLDFKETLHGRAYGHGVYHAMDQNTSVGYAQGAQMWPGSELNIASAMSLNEIVNAPTLFTSHTPYLVVQHIDWIQCRYLLVQAAGRTSDVATAARTQSSATASISADEGGPTDVTQDPQYTARSTLMKAIGVPLCAISTSKAFRGNNWLTKSPPNPKKKRKHTRDTRALDEHALATASDSDEMEDIQFLLSDDEGGKIPSGKSLDSVLVMNSTSLTDFVPKSLDRASLPMLEPPAYATPMATKTLQRNLREILEVQKKTPLHELGWYIDAELVDNFYQWIVELHTFDPATPLAKDMKAAGITSVVLEIRFGKDYPHSPPFVRIIRPRFLPFTMGGGGHVTAGGAMCMELLTNSGWSAVSSIESVLLQVRMAMMNPEPKPARLESQGMVGQRDYGVWEAIEAFKRACAAHGWAVPPDFGDFANNSGSSGT